MSIDLIGDCLGLVLQIGAVVALIKSLAAFASGTNHTQNNRLDNLEKQITDMQLRLDKGDEHFDRNDNANTVTQKALLALIEHALNGNNIQGLKEVKNELENYLVTK
jgi:hypothetical protein